MLFMVVERFAPAHASAIYGRLREAGRSMPEGLRYVDSFVRADLHGCYQLMECDDLALLQEWLAGWSDLMQAEIVPVTSSAATAAVMNRLDRVDG